ncbi:hypothetical protein C7M71_008275 [Peterkaempfera bronchialis]|uniref:Uncharacterized protein n=1 Tax=Peterkaempfera bronchialis TaxID=2126346 RepID=A0A345SUN1_9ACTN|nr:hypothetical protein C7M71_008275 [Peterkaempfera bronchialis]
MSLSAPGVAGPDGVRRSPPVRRPPTRSTARPRAPVDPHASIRTPRARGSRPLEGARHAGTVRRAARRGVESSVGPHPSLNRHRSGHLVVTTGTGAVRAPRERAAA